MELGKEHKGQVEEIIDTMECPTYFLCYKSGFKNLSTIRIIGDTELIECLEESGQGQKPQRGDRRSQVTATVALSGLKSLG